MGLIELVQAHPYTAGAAAAALLLLWALADNYDLLPSSSIYKNIPSAGRGNWLTGHFPEAFSVDPDIFSVDCFNKYGPIHTISGLFGKKRIVIQDSKALAHLIKNAYDYPKTNMVRGEIGRGVGHGVLWEEGENHKRQRKMLNPAFSAGSVKALAPVFTQLALQLADRLDALVAGQQHELGASFPGISAADEKAPGVILDCYHWFFRVALDAIGVGGFGRNYGSIHNEEQGIARVFSVWSANESQDFGLSTLVYRVMSILLPPTVKKLPLVSTKRQVVLEDMRVALDDDAKQMCEERKEWLASGGDVGEDSKKDLFTILMKGNMQSEGKDKLTDDEVFAQIKTFIFAGHETSSTGLSWTFHLLAKHPHIQDRLRAEIVQAKVEAEARGAEQIEPDALAALPLLDAVLRESLRVRPPIPGRSFVAQKDDVLPLAHPLTLTNGRVLTSLPVKKGQEFYTWHTLTNKRADVWGLDAFAFNPDRWLADPGAGKAGALGGAALWGQMMTFFGGPRSCIGYKFALTEMKAIIAVLVERFVFHDIGVPVSARTFIVMRPCTEGRDGETTNQMPLRITRVGQVA
ncbi:hypothetical protein HWV62_16712 [Athelia sp. TMB]|nr:hypothetical protein HWV62_16712 [Athelia sp. TMB]